MLTYDTPTLRQTGSRNLTGKKTLPTIWGTYMKLVTKYQIPVINSCLEKCDEKCAYMFNVYKNQLSRKQEVGIWRVQKRYPQYGIPIGRLWPNIRFLPSTVTEKNAMKNILDGQTDRGKTVYPPSPPRSRGIIIFHICFICWKENHQVVHNDKWPKLFDNPFLILLHVAYESSHIKIVGVSCQNNWKGVMVFNATFNKISVIYIYISGGQLYW